MPQELTRRYCPHCGKEVDAVRATSNDLVWYILFGTWMLLVWLFDIPRPWYCRECGGRIPEPEGRVHRRSIYNWLVGTFVVAVLVAMILAYVLKGRGD